MLRLATISFFILFFFGNCHKQNTEVKISYSVRETSVDAPAYNITYTSDRSGGTTNASSTAANWSSGGIILEQGQFISLTVDCSAPLFDLVISVYVNGSLWEQKEMHNPTTSVTISGKPE